VWAKLIRRGDVAVNDEVITSVSRNIAETDRIAIASSTDERPSLNLPIIYENENVVVIDKPAGVLTHSKGALNEEFTVADFIKSRSSAAPSTTSAGSGVTTPVAMTEPRNDGREGMVRGSSGAEAVNNRFGIVHRLDRATSGVIIGAKTAAAQKFLQKQFADRKAKKTYLAIVDKAPKQPAARIDLPIARNPKHPSEFRVDAKGKPAATDYKTLETYADGSALLELKPLTGRTHQLRVHLAYIGAPIAGDPVYCKLGAYKGKAGRRMFLHAKELEITIPAEPENLRQTFSSDLPDDFKDEIARRSAK
jgi:23S rRNA pseudouridine1911/1915/1917 synthase